MNVTEVQCIMGPIVCVFCIYDNLVAFTAKVGIKNFKGIK